MNRVDRCEGLLPVGAKACQGQAATWQMDDKVCDGLTDDLGPVERLGQFNDDAANSGSLSQVLPFCR